LRLRFTAPAARDLETILELLSRQSPGGARNVAARLRAITDLLLQHPRAGHATNRRGTRRIVVSPYPYLIFYRFNDAEIIVDAVRHAARHPSSMPARRP
jgi:toxin ParE1/3/4